MIEKMGHGGDRPMVSVVMVAYNAERVLDEAIRGVVRQRARFGFELIVADDASTDDTYSIAMRWAKEFPDIVRVVRHPENIGMQRNYVEALKLCRGKYIAMCDGDDYWICRSKLRRQVEYMESHPECSVCFHRVLNFYEADGSMSLSNGGQVRDCTIIELSRSNFITNLSVMYRGEAVDLHNLPLWILDNRLVDYPLHLLFAEHGSIHYFRRPMGVYRISASSAWSNAERCRQLEMALRVRQNLADWFMKRGKPDVVDGLSSAMESISAAIEKCGNGQETAPVSLKKRLRRWVSRFLPRPRS